MTHKDGHEKKGKKKMAITFFGDARAPGTDDQNTTAANAAITPPASMQANDYVLVFVAAKTTAVTITNTTTGGQTWTAETDFEGSSMSFRLFHCRFNGTWSANPVFDWVSVGPFVVWMVVFRGVDTTTAIDAALNQATFAAPSTPFDVTIASSTISPATNNAMVVAYWTSSDNNTWSGQAPADRAAPNGQAQWRCSGGTDMSGSILYAIQEVSGGSDAFTDRQATLGGDAGIQAIIALRPAPVTDTYPGWYSNLGGWF